MFTPEAIASYLSAALFTVVNLAIAYVVLKRFLFKPILNVLEKRRNQVAEELHLAEEKNNQAEKKIEESENKLRQTTQEVTQMWVDANNQAERQKQDLLEDARRQADHLLGRAEQDVQLMRAKMINDVKDEVAELSVSIAAKVIGAALDEKHNRELIDQFVTEAFSIKPDLDEQSEVF